MSSVSYYFSDNTSFLSLQNKINRMTKRLKNIKLDNINFLSTNNLNTIHNTKNLSSNLIHFQKMINNMFNEKNENIHSFEECQIKPANSRILKKENNNFLYGYNPKSRSNNRKMNKTQDYFKKVTYTKYNSFNKENNINIIDKVNSFSKDLKKNTSINNVINNNNIIDIIGNNIKNELCNNIKYLHIKHKNLKSSHTKSSGYFELKEDPYNKIKNYYTNYQKRKYKKIINLK
jgi:hypothetical protein